MQFKKNQQQLQCPWGKKSNEESLMENLQILLEKVAD